ncbi:MAG: hypothetical protein GEU98_16090 [Pseudonocardiaceae bacterium]|nr:hypothetical protein [Pseudonocardiaceae bacterium]
MSSANVYGRNHVEDPTPELDQATVEHLIAHIHNEYEGGTFGDMAGDSAATWIIDRLSHVLAHPEDL